MGRVKILHYRVDNRLFVFLTSINSRYFVQLSFIATDNIYHTSDMVECYMFVRKPVLFKPQVYNLNILNLLCEDLPLEQQHALVCDLIEGNEGYNRIGHISESHKL